MLRKLQSLKVGVMKEKIVSHFMKRQKSSKVFWLS